MVNKRLAGVAGLDFAVGVIALGNINLLIGTRYPFMPPVGQLEASATLVAFPILGAVLSGPE